MKSLILLFFSIFILLFYSNLEAQCLEEEDVCFNLPSDITVCNPEGNYIIEIGIKNIALVDTTNLTIRLSDVAGMQFAGVGTSTTPNITLLDDNDSTQPIFTLQHNMGMEASLFIEVEFGCAAAMLGASMNRFRVDFDCGLIVPSLPFGVTAPSLNIVSVTESGISPYNFGDIFTRTVLICNSGQGALTGFDFTSLSDKGIILQSIATSSGTILADADITQNGGAVTIPSSTIVAEAGPLDISSTPVPDGDGLMEFNECIQLIETYKILGCDNLNTSFEATWGCLGETCQTAGSSAIINAQSADATPEISFSLSDNYVSCPDEGVTQTLTITNSDATSPAYNVCFIVATQNSFRNVLDLNSFTLIGSGNINVNPTMNDLVACPIDPDAPVTIDPTVIEDLTAQTACSLNGSIGNAVANASVCIPKIEPGETVEITFDQYACDCAEFSCESSVNTQGSIIANASLNNICGNELAVEGTERPNTSINYAQLPLSTTITGTTGTVCQTIYQWNFQGPDGAYFEDGDLCDDCAIQFTFNLSPGLDYTGGSTYTMVDASGDMWTGDVTTASDGIGGEDITLIFEGSNFPTDFNGQGVEICLDIATDCNEVPPPPCGSFSEVEITQQVDFLADRTECPSCIIPLECENINPFFINCPTTDTDCICPIVYDVEIARSSVGCLESGCTMDDIADHNVLAGDTLDYHYEGMVKASAGTLTYHMITMNLVFTGDIGPGDFEIVGDVEVMITDQPSGTVYLCTAPVIDPMASTFDLSPTALTGCALPAGFELGAEDELEADLQIRIIKDINSNIGSFDIDTRVRWEGDEDTSGRCVPNIDRFFLYGSKEEVNGYGNIDILADGCGAISPSFRFRQFVGGTVFFDFFPCEIRQVHFPVRDQFIIPFGYDLVNIDLSLTYLDEMDSAVTLDTTIMQGDLGVDYLSNYPTTNDVVTLDFPTIFSSIFTPGGCDIDEGFRLILTYNLEPDCKTPDEPQNFESNITFGFDDVLSNMTPTPEDFLILASDTIKANQADFTPPEIIIQSKDGSPYCFPDAPPNNMGEFPFTWNLSILNNSGIAEANNVFFYIENLPTDVTLTGIFEADCMTAINPNSGGLYLIGSMDALSQQDICLRGTYAECSTGMVDTLKVGVGYFCGDTPPADIDEYTSESDFNCTPDIIDLTFKRPGYDLQISDATELPSNLDLCTIVDLKVRLTNGGLGNLFDLEFTLAPPSNIAIIPGSFKLCYNDDISSPELEEFAINDPTDNGDGTYTFSNLVDPNVTGAMIAGLSDGFPAAILANLTNSLNQMFVKYQVQSGCNFINGQLITYTATSNNRCGEFASSSFDPGAGIVISGVTAPNEVIPTANMLTLNSCDASFTDVLSVDIQGADADVDRVLVDLPVGINIISSSNTFTTEMEADGSTNAIIEVMGDNPSFTLEVSAANGLACSVGELEIEIITFVEDDVCCSTLMSGTVTCSSGSASGFECTIRAPSANITSTIDIIKYDLSMALVNSSGCDPNPFSAEIEFTNNSTTDLIAGTSFAIEIFNDLNYDGTIDAGDAIINNMPSSVTLRANLAANGGTTTETFTTTATTTSCALVARILPSADGCVVCDTIEFPFRNQEVIDVETSDVPGICYTPCTGMGESVDLATSYNFTTMSGTISSEPAYFDTFEDAVNNTNELIGAATTVSPTATRDYYVRFDDAKGCLDIVPVKVLVANCGSACPQFAAPTLNDIIACPDIPNTEIFPIGGGFPGATPMPFVNIKRNNFNLGSNSGGNGNGSSSNAGANNNINTGSNFSIAPYVYGPGVIQTDNNNPADSGTRIRYDQAGSTSFDPDDYVDLCLNVDSGFRLSLEKLIYGVRVNGDSTNFVQVTQVSVDGGPFITLGSFGDPDNNNNVVQIGSVTPNGTNGNNPFPEPEINQTIGPACSSICLRFYSYGAVNESVDVVYDNFRFEGFTEIGSCMPLTYNFYEDVGGTLGQPVAANVLSYDPMLASNTPATPGVFCYWVTAYTPAACCESDPVKVCIEVNNCPSCVSPAAESVTLEICGSGATDFSGLMTTLEDDVDTNGDGDGNNSDGDNGSSVQFFADAALTTLVDISTNTNYADGEILYAAVGGLTDPIDLDADCFATSQVTFRVYEPTATSGYSVEVCDDGDGDGSVRLDLTQFYDVLDPQGDGDGDSSDGDLGYQVNFTFGSLNGGVANPMNYQVSDGEILNFDVQILDNSAACTASGTMTVSVLGPTVANARLNICAPETDFVLEDAIPTIDAEGDGDGSSLDGDSGNSVEGFFTTQPDALAGDGADTDFDGNPDVSALPSPYTASSGTIIFARVVDVNGCVAVPGIELVIDPAPSADPVNLFACNLGNGTANFDLSLANDAADPNGDGDGDDSDGDDGNCVMYYSSLAAAQGGGTPVNSPYNGTDGETLFIRVENQTGCASTETLTLNINASPTANISFDNCDPFEGEVSIEVTGGTPSFTYDLVLNGGDFSMPLESNTTGIFTGLEDDTYQVQVTDANGCTDVVTFGVPLPCALPVELLSFKGKPQKEDILLEWMTASEIDNDYFEILHGLDGKTFKAIGTVDGAGNSLEEIKYNFLHEDAGAGLHYYRLQQYDFDGKSSLSKVIAVELNAKEHFVALYPNPSNQYVRLMSNQDFPSATQVHFYNSNGVLVRTILVEENRGELNIDLRNFAVGHYTVKTIIDDQVYINRFVKMEE